MLLKLSQKAFRDRPINITFTLPPADRGMHFNASEGQYSEAMIISPSG